MTLLTRMEELYMLAVFRLQEPAYLVNIRDHLLEHTGKDWAFGSLYMALEKLKKKGLVMTYHGKPEEMRGGKAKKFYRLTEKGTTALLEAKHIQDVMWKGVSESLGRGGSSHES